jgi:hypothetical protein
MAELVMPSPFDDDATTTPEGATTDNTRFPATNFDVDPSGNPMVDGQKIRCLFTAAELEMDPALDRPAQVFTNGAEVHFEHQYRQFVETQREKKCRGRLTRTQFRPHRCSPL